MLQNGTTRRGIDSNAFENCTSLASVDLGGIGYIGMEAFSGCKSIASITIPESVDEIEDYAFSGCTGLKDVIIPRTGNISIAYSAFSGGDDLTFHTQCETPATLLLRERGYTVDATDHELVYLDAVLPTCTETGLTEGSYCSVCGNDVVVQEVVPATGHSAVVDARVEATCTEAGLTEGSYCSVCGSVIKAQEIIPAKGHTVVIDEAVAATCTAAGKKQGSHCSVCGKVIKAQADVPTTAHTVVIDKGIAATYAKEGMTQGSHCSVCGTVLAKQEEIARLPLPSNGVLLNKNGSKTLKAGKKLTIVKDGSQPKSFKSSNTAVATVSAKGVVTAKLAGKPKITVSLKNGKKVVLTLKVTDTKAPKQIAITQGKKVTLKVGGKLALKVKLTPASARYALTWSSSNTKVATVTQKGVVKGVKKGKAKITVTTQNGVKATITVTVK